MSAVVRVPRLVVAAPSSGSGKTTVATGLMAAFSAAGLRVSPHKVGPDYIDPGYHALAVAACPAPRPGRNLDAYLCGPERVAPLFAHGAAGSDLAVVEGVMGLFDGAAGQGELASTAQVAKALRAPVVLVVDAASQSRSVAALVHGFASWDPELRLAGIILNKVGSDRHEAMLREALEATGVPVLGALRRAGEVRTPSRHLGLVPVAERRDEAVESVAELAARVRAGCDLDAILGLARTAPPLHCVPWDPSEAVAEAAGDAVPGRVPGRRRTGGRPVVAVAGGAAFTFCYAEHTELLAAAGAEVAVFDPLRDERLPRGTAAVVVGGGFPEVYAAELSANAPLRREMAALAARGAPVAAECAGLLYLSRSLDGAPMCGVLQADGRMSRRLTLGYRQAVALGDSALLAAGTRTRGHEFHRTVLEPGHGPSPAWGLTWGGATGAERPERRAEGFVQGGVHASYLHTHWAATPSAARRLVEGAVRVGPAPAAGGGR